jgi:hypothetical protein
VDFNDLVMLAQRYNTTLAAYAAAAGAATTNSVGGAAERATVGAAATSGSFSDDWSRALAVASGEKLSSTNVTGDQTTRTDGGETKSGPPARGVKAKAEVKRAADMAAVPPTTTKRVFGSKRVRREILA